MKHGKLFAKIIYFLFTFTIGILLAIFLPFAYMSDGEYLNIMQSSLDDGEYADAMLLVGGYFDDRAVYTQQFEEGGGIVLFSAVTLVYTEDEEEVSEAKVHKAYAGFIYGTEKVYDVTDEAKNKSEMLVEDGEGKVVNVDILDGDINGDQINDTVTTYYTNGFFYMEFDDETYSSLRKITFIDKNGNVFKEIALNLNFDEQFFTDVDGFVEEYNRDYKSEKLNAINDELLAKSGNYKKSSMGIAKSKADTKAAIIVVVYFLCVYIIADFLLGYHFIIRFFRWFLYKVCKVKPKQKQRKEQKDFFGSDYYCQLTFELDLSKVGNFTESVQIRYTDVKGEEICFILIRQNRYVSTQRVKAGKYVNMWIDIDKSEYVTEDLPETLWVDGYRKTLKIKILRREEKRDENFNSTPD